jgi:hypothetical protein
MVANAPQLVLVARRYMSHFFQRNADSAAFAYSKQTGHPFQGKLDTHSRANWTVGA